MIVYEQRPGGRYDIWATNEYGKEPLGSLRRDSSGHWFYQPLAGTYMYLGALMDIAGKLYELSLLPDAAAGPATEPAEAPPRSRNFSVMEGDAEDDND